MAKKSSGFIGTFGGDPKNRLSNVLAGDRTGRGKASTFSAVRQGNYNRDPALGVPVTRPAVAQRKDIPPGSIDIRGYFGDERTGIRKTAGQKIASALKAGVVDKKAKPANVVRTTTDMKMTPARMAVNPRTGSTLGFTTGKVTGSTASKSGMAMRTPMTAGQRTARAALEKGGVAGPSKTAGGKNVSYGFGSLKSMAQSAGKSIGGMARSAGKSIGGMGGGMRSGGGRATDPSRGGMGNSGRGTGSKK